MFNGIRPRLPRRSVPVGALLFVLLLTACSGGAEAPTEEPVLDTEPETPVQVRTFEELWTTVNENYVYDDFHGVDWNAIHDEYATQISADMSAEEYDVLLNAMIAELPTDLITWQTRSDRIEAEIQSTTAYEGIGSYVGVRSDPDPRVVLLSVMEGSPANQAGLQTHDSILAIDGIPVAEDEGLNVVQRIRGPANSAVELTVRSPGSEPREVTVTRASLPFSATSIQQDLLNDETIGYMLFPPAPYDELPNQMVSLLQTFVEQRHVDGLVLDMRITTANSGWPLGLLLALFADGNLGTVHSRSEDQPLLIEGEDVYGSQDLPLAIIVGPDTNGAIEVFAAAMQASGRAVVIGLPTPGAVELMSEYMLPDGSRALIATQSYRTPEGTDIGLSGVRPDVAVEIDWDAVTDSDDPVRDAAVQALLDASG
jgi:C-terminal peptidase prc